MAFNLKASAGDILEEEYTLHKGVGLGIKLENEPSSNYQANSGKAALLNGISGSAAFADGEWVAWEGKDMVATITLGKDSVEKVSMNFHNQVSAWIHHPQHFEMYSSEDGINFKKIAEKMSHHVAEIYRIKERGYIREGYFADLVLVDLNQKWQVTRKNILYKCQWTPFENQFFKSKIVKTFVNGNIVYDDGIITEGNQGKRLLFSKIR